MKKFKKTKKEKMVRINNGSMPWVLDHVEDNMAILRTIDKKEVVSGKLQYSFIRVSINKVFDYE